MKKITKITTSIYCFFFGHQWIESKVYNHKMCLNCGKIKNIG